MRRALPAVARVPGTLTPSLSRVHPGAVHRMSFRGRGGTRASGPRTSHRSDSPTDARSVGSCCARGEVDRRLDASTSQLTRGLRPREETRESREEMCLGASFARLRPNLEYGAVRRFPMRSEGSWIGQPGLPHGTTQGGSLASGCRGNNPRSCGVTKSRPAIPVGITEISRGSSEANTPGKTPPKHNLHPERGA